MSKPGEKGWVDTESVDLSKVTEKQWKSMGTFFEQANEFSKSGGMKAFLGGSIETIKDQLMTQMKALLSPITNEVNAFIIEILSDEGLKAVFEELGEAVGELLDKFEDIGGVDALVVILSTLVNVVTWVVDLFTDFLELVESLLELLGFIPTQPPTSPTNPQQDPDVPSGRYLPDYAEEEDI